MLKLSFFSRPSIRSRSFLCFYFTSGSFSKSKNRKMEDNNSNETKKSDDNSNESKPTNSDWENDESRTLKSPEEDEKEQETPEESISSKPEESSDSSKCDSLSDVFLSSPYKSPIPSTSGCKPIAHRNESLIKVLLRTSSDSSNCTQITTSSINSISSQTDSALSDTDSLERVRSGVGYLQLSSSESSLDDPDRLIPKDLVSQPDNPVIQIETPSEPSVEDWKIEPEPLEPTHLLPPLRSPRGTAVFQPSESLIGKQPSPQKPAASEPPETETMNENPMHVTVKTRAVAVQEIMELQPEKKKKSPAKKQSKSKDNNSNDDSATSPSSESEANSIKFCGLPVPSCARRRSPSKEKSKSPEPKPSTSRAAEGHSVKDKSLKEVVASVSSSQQTETVCTKQKSPSKEKSKSPQAKPSTSSAVECDPTKGKTLREIVASFGAKHKSDHHKKVMQMKQKFMEVPASPKEEKSSPSPKKRRTESPEPDKKME